MVVQLRSGCVFPKGVSVEGCLLGGEVFLFV